MRTIKRITPAIVLLILLLTAPFCSGSASTTDKSQGKNAIVIASFGTTVPSGVQSIMNIVDKVRAAYPGTEVRITFTSNIIRSVWRERRAEPVEWLAQDVPEEVLYVKNIISTLGDLKEDGYDTIIVQPTHMFFMEQSYDLQQYIKALDSIETMKPRWRPFNQIIMGRPALGMPGNRHPYQNDIEAVARTLAGDAQLAREQGAILFYMGHGNKHWSTGVYLEAQDSMRKMYPETKTYIGVAEGYPELDHIIALLDGDKTKNIIIKPFMIVAGDHAVNDMAGAEENSWKSRLTGAGYRVEPIMQGLGSNNAFAQIFVDHIHDAAVDAGIDLR